MFQDYKDKYLGQIIQISVILMMKNYTDRFNGKCNLRVLKLALQVIHPLNLQNAIFLNM